jgi:uncharacterized membrane protein
MLFLKVMWRAAGKAALSNPATVGLLAMAMSCAVVAVLGALALSHAFSWTLKSVMFWCGVAAFGGVMLGSLVGSLLEYVFKDMAKVYKKTKKEVLAERVAPEHDSKGGLSAVD